MSYTIGGSTAGLYPPFLEKLNRYAEAMKARYGVTYVVGIGVRTYESQLALRKRYEAGDYPNFVAIPDVGPYSKARHMFGLAADLRPNPMPQAHLSATREFGLRADVPNEPWHVYDENSGDLILRGVVKVLHDGDVSSVKVDPGESSGSSSPVPTSTISRPTLKNGMNGGSAGNSLFTWLRNRFRDPNTRIGTMAQRTDLSTTWIGNDKWMLLQQFCRDKKVNLLTDSQTLDTWGPRCWAAAESLGYSG